MPDLVRPGDPRYDLSRSQFIGRPHEVLPMAVARCADADDVMAALALARAHGWPFAVRGGGHSNACHSSTAGLLIDTTPSDGITVAGETVTVGAGVRIGHLSAALAPRLVPTGSCPSVGVVGAALGGGFGSHGRRLGLTCDSLESARVVVASGKEIDAPDDLLWALRGAGAGGFGIITEATFTTHPALPRTHIRLGWPITEAPALIRAWQRWSLKASDDVSIELVLLSPDDGDPLALLVGAAPTYTDLTPILAEIDIEPTIHDVRDLDATDAAILHATPYSAAARDATSIPLVSERPGMTSALTEFFADPLPDEAITALLAHFTADRVFGELREVAFTPWAGAYARTPPTATAFPHRHASYLVKHTVLIGPRGAAERADEALTWLRRSWSTLHRHGTGGIYPNFPDPNATDWLTAYYGPNAERLVRIKAKYDPENVFRSAQSVPRAWNVTSGY